MPVEKIDVKAFMNAASRDRLGWLQVKIENRGWPADLRDEKGRSGLWCAALEARTVTVAYFIRMEVDIEAKDNVEGWTPLAACCTGRSGDEEAVLERLLKAGANIDARDNRGRTPLMLVSRGHDSQSMIQRITH